LLDQKQNGVVALFYEENAKNSWKGNRASKEKFERVFGGWKMGENKMKYETWSEFKKKIYSEEEIAEADLKADLICSIIEARTEKGLSQRDLEEASGVKQPVIARLEKGQTSPQLGTILKALGALGKTLAIVPRRKEIVGV
jgi:ribosome-binding protein aMBF1 (putative translation factor)